jgi:hypothetical protein
VVGNGLSPPNAVRQACPPLGQNRRPVHAEYATDLSVPTEDRDEASIRKPAVNHKQLVIGSDAAGHLDPTVVLIRPDVRHRIERCGGSFDEQAACGVLGLLDGVRPMLYAEPLPITTTGPARDVTGRNDARRGKARGVADHPVVEIQP